MTLGNLSRIFTAPAAGVSLRSVQTAAVEAGRGITGDRYFLEIGSFSRWPGDGRHVSLIEQEVIDAVATAHRIDLSAGQSRRNLVTQGVHLSDLNGRVFRIGTAIFRGARECAPCGYLERLVPGSFRALKGRGGLRANVLQSGLIAEGDAIEFADIRSVATRR